MKTENLIEIGKKFLEHGTWDILHQMNYIRNYSGCKTTLIDDIHQNIKPLDYVAKAITVEKFLEMVRFDDVADIEIVPGDTIVAFENSSGVGYQISFDADEAKINVAMGISDERVEEMLGDNSPLHTEGLDATIARIAKDSKSDTELAMFMFLLGRIFDRKHRNE